MLLNSLRALMYVKIFNACKEGILRVNLCVFKFTFPNFQHSYFLFKEIYVQHLPHMNAN